MSAADEPAHDTAYYCGAKRNDAGAVMVASMVVVVKHARWWWRRRDVVVARSSTMVHRGRRASVVVSAVWRGKACSGQRQAGEDRSEGFDGLVVHITPSLSFCLFLFSAGAPCVHIMQGKVAAIS